MEMMIRLSKEFGFSITTFHHALEAYKIPDILRENAIRVAIFSDLWGYKMEALDGSVWAPSILAEHGIEVALKSDHPVRTKYHEKVTNLTRTRRLSAQRI